MDRVTTENEISPMAIVLPLALAQFTCSYAGTTMNVSINAIATDLNISIHAVQTVITFFTLTMAALMIPGSKLTDIWGRKFCFRLGLLTYGVGALLATFAWSLPSLFVGYSLLEGIGTALLIPPVYILVTVKFPDVKSRAKYFGIISGAAGLGSAAGPLLGGIIASAISWRAAFTVQVLAVAAILIMSRKIIDPGVQGDKPRFDFMGAVLSALGLVFVVIGILQSGTYGWFTASKDFTIGSRVVIQQGGISPVWLFVAIGVIFLAAFYLHLRSDERAGNAPLIATRLFRNRISDLGLVTQNMQWLIMQGSFFVISVYLQTLRHFSPIQTGLTLTPATIGILLASAAAGRMAARRTQSTLIRAGFALVIVGMLLLLILVRPTASILTFVPGIFLFGFGVGIMLTASVNVVQSSFPERDQGEISGLSRSVSNLGSSFGTSIAGSVLVSAALPPDKTYPAAIIVMGVFAFVGLIAAIGIPSRRDLFVEATAPPELSEPAPKTT